jgi:recombination protein RecA
MAKKKKEDVQDVEYEVDIDKINEEIRKQYGTHIVKGVSSLIDAPPQVIPISPMFDMNLCGGITEGISINLSGPPKSGKSTCALSIAADCQKPENGGRHVFYYNVEGRLKRRDVLGIKGIDINKFELIGSEKGKILTAQDYLQIAEKYIIGVPNSVHIIDSYSSLCTAEEYGSEMDKFQRADGAKLLKKFSRKISNVIPVNRTILIGIQHLIANVNGYGGMVEAGGMGIAYGSDIRLRATHFKYLLAGGKDDDEEADGAAIGQKVFWKVVWNALGPPGAKFTSFIKYGSGIDRERELLEIATSLGLIEKGGAWYTFSFLEEEKKFQGAENARQALADNPEWYESLNKKFRETMGL